ncbi:hypothetical protein JQC91_03635 [Jannaschia sp. Os4]|uniref:DUF6525 family protein n=1 Tax=Jannaschia sp. Os4 TaxID=2807617 RepID=UPI001939B0BE|nr:DUF6525 family protein [Jannaschia sp. Os4]MBM2575385.1 hypothetical protein [Jannaschia sp. Os4]
MQGNSRTRLGLSPATRNAMADYDRCPPALRRWLADAKLQWSPASARRAWRRALLKSWGRESKALELMDRIEDERLARDPLVQALERRTAGSEQGPRGS